MIERNCTHKGCNELYEIRAFYGYYYHVSQYTQFCELGLSHCAKARKLNEKMDYVV